MIVAKTVIKHISCSPALYQLNLVQYRSWAKCFVFVFVLFYFWVFFVVVVVVVFGGEGGLGLRQLARAKPREDRGP